MTEFFSKPLPSPPSISYMYVDMYIDLLPPPLLSSPPLPLPSSQLRVHTTHHSQFYLHVTSRAIIEDCTAARFAPYNWSYAAIEKHFEVRIVYQASRNSLLHCLTHTHTHNVHFHLYTHTHTHTHRLLVLIERATTGTRLMTSTGWLPETPPPTGVFSQRKKELEHGTKIMLIELIHIMSPIPIPPSRVP